MRRRFMRSDSQRGVKQKHALPSPAFKAAVIRARESDGGVFKQLFVHIDQRRGGSDAVGNTEAQPVRLTVIVIPDSN